MPRFHSRDGSPILARRLALHYRSARPLPVSPYASCRECSPDAFPVICALDCSTAGCRIDASLPQLHPFLPHGKAPMPGGGRAVVNGERWNTCHIHPCPSAPSTPNKHHRHQSHRLAPRNGSGSRQIGRSATPLPPLHRRSVGVADNAYRTYPTFAAVYGNHPQGRACRAVDGLARRRRGRGRPA